MKISEAIARLQYLKWNHGDLELCYWDGCGAIKPLNRIEVKRRLVEEHPQYDSEFYTDGSPHKDRGKVVPVIV